jgi:hypothetical protein
MASLALVSRPAWITVEQLLITRSELEPSAVQTRHSCEGVASAARAERGTPATVVRRLK